MSDIDAELTEHVLAAARAELPADVDRMARLLALDAFGCALAGLATPEWAAARAFVAGSGTEGGATVLGEPLRRTPAAAAFANTIAARAQLFDDTYGPGHLHAGAALTFASFAVGEADGRPLGEVLRAVALGAEVAYRVGAAAGEAHYARGFHSTGTCVVFGTTAAATVLLGLAAPAARHALSLAGDHAAGLRRYQHGGSPANSALHAANAAEWGIRCAALGAAGFPAPPSMLAGVNGFLRTFGSEQDAETTLRAGLGASWLILDTSVKAYPSCRSTHGAATAVDQLRDEHGLTPDDVARIVVTVSPHAYKCDRPDPASELDAQFSIQYVLAHLLVHGRLRADDFTAERRADARVRSLLPLIEVRRGAELLETHTVVEVTTRGGQLLSRTVRVGEVLGDQGNPLSAEQIRRKFAANAVPAITEDQAGRLAGYLLGAAASSPAADALALARGGRDPSPRIQRSVAAY
jgi:2-methylcitrate dehydratase PrpD